MATQNDIKDDPRYIPIHNHGFVGLVDYMGSDGDICRAARISYGQGTKSPSDDRGLIRYLLRHRHTSPIEMCEVKFHIKLPIFIMRQLVRHRTANLNEYSGRYSEMVDEFYVPSLDYIQPQSKTNKQGRSGVEIPYEYKLNIQKAMEEQFESAHELYKDLLSEFEGNEQDLAFPGLSRELARIILPVANYTECYWKCDLHNLLHLLGLRLDPHAQQEIRDFSEAIYKLSVPLFPLVFEAWEDYVRQAKTFSRMELIAIKKLLAAFPSRKHRVFIEPLCHEQGMSKRETDEFIQFLID